MPPPHTHTHNLSSHVVCFQECATSTGIYSTEAKSQSLSLSVSFSYSQTHLRHKFSFFVSSLAETEVSTWKTATAIINLLLERKKFPPLPPKMSLTWKDWAANNNQEDTKRQKPQNLQKSSTDKWLEIHWRLSKTLIHHHNLVSLNLQ